jgi:hypothetical protein
LKGLSESKPKVMVMAQYIDEHETNRLAAAGTPGYATANGAAGARSILVINLLLSWQYTGIFGLVCQFKFEYLTNVN